MPEFPSQLSEVERTKQQIRELVAEIAQLARSDLEPTQFYTEFLNRVVAALAAVGGAVWVLDHDGNLKLGYQYNMPALGESSSNGAPSAHLRLLHQVMAKGSGALVPPRSGLAETDEEAALANPTEHLLVLGALTMNRQPAGVVEVFQRPNTRPATQRGYLQFLNQMCSVAGDYLKNRQLRQMADRQHLWGQLESFTEEVHRDLNLKQCAYSVANEGRRLVEADRVSVVLRFGRRSLIEAISGQDTVDRRSNLVRQMTKLANAVVRTGEPLYYYGDSEDLPPTLERALTEYVDESGSKTILIEPLRPPSEGTEESPCFGAVVVERIEDSTPDAVMVERLQILTRHSTSALKNSLEHHRVFLLPLWKMLGNASSLFRGRRGVQVAVAVVILAGLVASLFLVPWDFRPQAKGELLPRKRANVFAPMNAEVDEVLVKHGDRVKAGDALLKLKSDDLDIQLSSLEGDLEKTRDDIVATEERLRERDLPADQSTTLRYDKVGLENREANLREQVAILTQRRKKLTRYAPIDGIVTTWYVEELLRPKTPVQLGQVLLEVADDNGEWIAEVKMPEERMGHVLRAKKNRADGHLPVTFILASRPDQSYQGHVVEYAERARLTETDGNVVVLTVEPDPDAAAELKPETADFVVAGAEVRAKVNCGPHSLGYVIFVDVIEFFHRLFF